MRLNRLRAYVAVSILSAAAACGGAKSPSSGAPPADAKRVDTAKAGTLAGRVMLDGPSPVNPPIKMAADPYCIEHNANGASFESFVTDDGGLENVFVYVKDGLGAYRFDTPAEPVKLDQEGCRYHPHVLGVRTGQKLIIGNGDDTMHNVHAMPNANREFNAGQPAKNMTTEKVFTAREVMVPFKCNVHNWMQAYVGVLEHPYFAVTHDGGKFELKDLPAGTYTVEAWHEKLGAQTQSVTLGEKQTKAVTFTFKAPAAATGN